jgi:hypothetical protein
MTNDPLNKAKLRKFFSFIYGKLSKNRKIAKEFFYGLTLYELEKEFQKEKGQLNNLLMLTIFGDLAGLPLFPSYYSMRILPYIIPLLETWKRSLYREKDITDIFTSDL